MASYHIFTSARTAPAELTSLITTLRSTVGPDAGVSAPTGQNYTVKKAAPFSAADLTAAQTAIDGAPDLDAAAAEIDNKALKACILGLWEAIPGPLLTRPNLRARIIAIWKGLS